MTAQQQNQSQPTRTTKAAKWSFFLALHWRLANVIIAAARLACSYLKTLADGSQPGHLPSGCEALC